MDFTKDALFTVVERAASFKFQASTEILASPCLFEILRLSGSAGQLIYICKTMWKESQR